MKKAKLWKVIIATLWFVVFSSISNLDVLGSKDIFYRENKLSFVNNTYETKNEEVCLATLNSYLKKLPLSKKFDDQFAPTSILSPVVGPLRFGSTAITGFWVFNQHRTGAHVPGGGWGNSNDTYAWDINLYLQGDNNADAGKPVYATSNGTVVGYTGFGLPNSCNAVLIAHPNSQNPEWYSGYLHLNDNPSVNVGQPVTSNTVIGTIGRKCADNDHLHFVVYTGTNTNGGLVSFNANITERTACNNGSSTLRNIDGGPPIHPPGSVLRTAADPTVYLIDSNGRKRPLSATALSQLYNQSTDSRTDTNFNNWVITVGQDELDLYEPGGSILSALPSNGRNGGFPDGKLIKNNSNGEISIVTSGGKRRPFVFASTFTGLGYSFSCTDNAGVSEQEYNSYPAGPPVDAMLLQTSNINVSPGPYVLGQTISGSFTIKNVGYSSIPISSLVLGGVLNGNCCYDMTAVSTTLNSGQSYNYSGNRQLTSAGTYNFFAAYQESNGHWTDYMPASPGLIRTRQVQVGSTSCPSPTIIAFNQTINGTLQSSDCSSDSKFYDAYTFSGTAGQQIYITLSAQFDTYLYLYQGSYPGGSLIASDDDGGGGTNSRIPASSGFFTLPSTGTYTILASSYFANATGNYTLFLGTGGQSCSYSINPTNQSFSSSGGTGTVNVSAGSGCNWTASSNAAWITINSGSSGSGNGPVGYSVAANSGQARTGTITIAGQTFTVNQSGATTGCSTSSIALGQSITGTLQNGDCLRNSRYYDAYTFSGTAGQRIYITLTSANTTQLDPYLYLYRGSNTSGTPLNSNDDSGGTLNSRIPANSGYLRLPSTGTYTILASSFGAGQSGNYTITLGFSLTTLSNFATKYDFDSDGKTDYGVFRPSDGTWYFQSTTNGFEAAQFGVSTDKIAPADYDGDGRTDIAVFRDGNWYLLQSTNGFASVQFGVAGDIPQPGNYDSDIDGRAEIGVFRPSNGTWYWLNLQNNQFNAVQFGANGDKPVVADYDGDSRDDPAVYRNGVWYLLKSSEGFTGIQFGISTDKATPADFDGNGSAELGVYRNGIWYILKSNGELRVEQFGIADDKPVTGDYDGDGKADVAIWRPANGTFYVLQSLNGFTSFALGQSGDAPVASAYVP